MNHLSVKLTLITVIGVTILSSYRVKPVENQKCAEEAAAIVQMAVEDGYNWKYASTLGNIVYEECIARN